MEHYVGAALRREISSIVGFKRKEIHVNLHEAVSALVLVNSRLWLMRGFDNSIIGE